MRRLNLSRRVLHWAVALLILVQVPLGLLFTDFDNQATTDSLLGAGSFNALYDLHKSIGVTILALVMLRIVAMLVWPAPDHGPALRGARLMLAKLNHGALYALLVVTPILGWMGVSAYRAPVPVFGMFEAPHLAEQNREVSNFVLSWHVLLAFVLIAAVVIHIGAAIHHRNFRRDGVFARIALWGGRGASSER